MSVFVDDTVWYVFTRDNIKDNPELEELGISYDQMHSILYDNYVYMDAFVIYENGGFVELFIRKKALDTEVVNLANYSNEQVLELAELLAEKQGAEVYSVYENQYKFVKLEYVDSNYGYYVCEFATIINKDNYTLTFQSDAQFTEREYEEMEGIVDSVVFEIEESLVQTETASFLGGLLEDGVVGFLSSGIVVLIAGMIGKAKKKRSKEAELVSSDSSDSEE